MGRLKPGVTLSQAQAALEPAFDATMRVTLDALPPPAAAGFKDFVEGFRFRITSPASGGISGFRQMLEQPLRILWGVVSLVLLIACANLAGLSLSRLVQRQREFGIRLALGARRGRIIRQVLVEALSLAVAGGCVGAIVAQWAAPVALAVGTGEAGLKAVDLRLDSGVLPLCFRAWFSVLRRRSRQHA